MFKNQVGYSHSKERMLGECALQYWRYTYGSWGGWWNRSKPPKNARAGELYERKFVESVPTWRGKLVHTAAERGLKAAMGGRRFSDRNGIKAFLTQRTKSMFDRQWEQATQQKTGSPKHRLILKELRDGDPVNPTEVWNFVEGRLNTLCGEDEIWSGFNTPVNLFVRAVNRPKRIVLVEELLSFNYAGLTVWIAADLIMRSTKDHKVCVIVDWKTGRPKSADTRQAALYSAWSRQRGWSSSESIIAYVGQSSANVQHHTVDESQVKSALESIELYAEDLRDRLVDGDLERNEPIFEMFEPTDDPKVCESCPFADICEREGTKP